MFRARVRSTGEAVAVKIAKQDRRAIRGVAGEIEELSKLHQRDPRAYRWVVPLLWSGSTLDGRPFMMLPWAEESLHDWLHNARPGIAERIAVLRQCAAIVVRLHRGVLADDDDGLAQVMVHRDLKPPNLLVQRGEDGPRVLLADLGGAKERDLAQHTDNTGMYTPAYAPVEQCLPIPLPQDTSLDVHALAVVVYEVLTGRVPQSTQTRHLRFSDLGHEFYQLALRRASLSSGDEARWADLRQRDVGELFDLEGELALHPADLYRLRHRLEDDLQGIVDDPFHTAGCMVAQLEPRLMDALHPHPKGRAQDPRGLLAALQQCSTLLPDPVFEAAGGPVSRPADSSLELISQQEVLGGQGGTWVPTSSEVGPIQASALAAVTLPSESRVETPPRTSPPMASWTAPVPSVEPGVDPLRRRALPRRLGALLGLAGLLSFGGLGLLAFGAVGLGMVHANRGGLEPAVAEPLVDAVVGPAEVGGSDPPIVLGLGAVDEAALPPAESVPIEPPIVSRPRGVPAHESPGTPVDQVAEPRSVQVAPPTPEHPVEGPVEVDGGPPPIQVTVWVDYSAIDFEARFRTSPTGICSSGSGRTRCTLTEGAWVQVHPTTNDGSEPYTTISMMLDQAGLLSVKDRESGNQGTRQLVGGETATIRFVQGEFGANVGAGLVVE